jgi:hypothetical protein
MTELLTLGGLVTGLAAVGFWVVALVVFGIYIALTENEHYGWATTITIAIFVGLGVFGVFNLWNFALGHPGRLAFDAGMYVLAGAFWGAVKWYFYCKKQRRKYDEAKADFLKSRNATELTGALRVEWTEKLHNLGRYDRYSAVQADPPLAKNNKERIMNWMYLWPFSVFGTFCSEFIIKLWNNVYKWMVGIYDSIARAVWSGTENDLATEEEIEAARQAAATAMQASNTPPKTHSAGMGYGGK